MFVLLFVYVFGGAIVTPGFDYVDFLMPGIIVQSIAFGGFVTALGLSEDVQKGLIDRFRSLPMSRAAVLTGRTLSDILLNCLSLTVLLGVGFIAGFNFQDTTAAEVVLGIFLLLLFGYAFSWIFALVGLFSSSPETANSIGFTAIFPLTFASSAFVPAESMPDGLQQFANANPFTTSSTPCARCGSARRPTPTSGWRSCGARCCWRSSCRGRRTATSRWQRSRAVWHTLRCAFGSSQRPSSWPSRPPCWRPPRPRRLPARAEAAAVSGTLGRVARVQASGGESTSRSIPAKLPDGIAMSDGLVSVSTESAGAAIAQAEAYDLELFGGVVSASIVSRTATGTTKGMRYRGTVLDLVVGEREIGEVKGTKTYTFDAGTVVVNKDGEGLRVELTEDYEGFPAGTTVVVADVSATRGRARTRADRDRFAGADAPSRPRRPRRSRPRRRGRATRRAELPQAADVEPLRLPGRRADDDRRAVRLLPPDRRPPGQRPLRRLRHARSSPPPTARSRTSARCRSPATACGWRPTAATSSSTRTSRPSRPRRSTAATSRRGRSSATSATPATPSRRRRTCTSRSTRTAATPSIPTRSWSPGRSAPARPWPILPNAPARWSRSATS